MVVIVALAVGGNFYSGWLGREGTTTTARRVPSVRDAVRAAAAVVVGEVVAVRREGPAKDPTAIGDVRVDQVLKGRVGAPSVTVADRGFDASWRRGDRVLLFLRLAAGQEAADAPWRVNERFFYVAGRLQAPFTEADVRRAAS